MPYLNKAKQKESHHKWHIKNRSTILLKQREYRLRIKKQVLAHYSGERLECYCCHEQMIQFLSIDHADGGGTKHRKQIGTSYLYFWLIKNNFPGGYRVLCHNCNQAIGSYGICPHNKLKIQA